MLLLLALFIQTDNMPVQFYGGNCIFKIWKLEDNIPCNIIYFPHISRNENLCE